MIPSWGNITGQLSNPLQKMFYMTGFWAATFMVWFDLELCIIITRLRSEAPLCSALIISPRHFLCFWQILVIIHTSTKSSNVRKWKLVSASSVISTGEYKFASTSGEFMYVNSFMICVYVIATGFRYFNFYSFFWSQLEQPPASPATDMKPNQSEGQSFATVAN